MKNKNSSKIFLGLYFVLTGLLCCSTVVMFKVDQYYASRINDQLIQRNRDIELTYEQYGMREGEEENQFQTALTNYQTYFLNAKAKLSNPPSFIAVLISLLSFANGLLFLAVSFLLIKPHGQLRLNLLICAVCGQTLVCALTYYLLYSRMEILLGVTDMASNVIAYMRSDTDQIISSTVSDFILDSGLAKTQMLFYTILTVFIPSIILTVMFVKPKQEVTDTPV